MASLVLALALSLSGVDMDTAALTESALWLTHWSLDVQTKKKLPPLAVVWLLQNEAQRVMAQAMLEMED